MYSPLDVLKDLQDISFFQFSKEFHTVYLKDGKIYIDATLIPIYRMADILKKAEENELLLYLYYDDEKRVFFLTWRHLHDTR